MYARYCELRADGRDDEAANVLKEIEDYNRYDCRSTHRLRDWLIKLAIESGVPPLGPQPVADGAAVEDTDELARTLMAFAGDGVDGRTPEQTAVAMIAAARGYPPARGQTVLVGAFRPAQQPGRRVGRHQRRVPRRRGRGRQGLAPAVVTRPQAATLGEAHRRAGRGRTGHRACSRSTSRPPPGRAGRQSRPARRGQRRDHRRRRPQPSRPRSSSASGSPRRAGRSRSCRSR